MDVDVLVVGAGICGTMLSWYLQREGLRVLLYDEETENSSSLRAAGVINPVTGRRYHTTWMANVLHPFAKEAYTALGTDLQSQFIFPRTLIDFFPTAEARDVFIERLREDDTYLHSYPDQNHFNAHFHYNYGCGEITPAYAVNLPLLLASYKNLMLQKGVLRKEKIDPAAVQLIDGGVQYAGITARWIIFCEGTAAVNNPWFHLLPFSPTKGEALVIECAGLPNQFIFKRGQMIVPLPVQHTYWVGSSFEWQFAHPHPTETFRQKTETHLRNWLKHPFKVLFHHAAVRPATVERRPFVGLHPAHPQVGIFNGTGTKGASLAPYFAHEFAQRLVHHLPLTPAADVTRFKKILSKQ